MINNVFNKIKFNDQNISQYTFCEDFNVSQIGDFLKSIFSVSYILTKDNKEIIVIYEKNTISNMSLTNAIHNVYNELKKRFNITETTTILQVNHSWHDSTFSIYNIFIENDDINWQGETFNNVSKKNNITQSSLILNTFKDNKEMLVYIIHEQDLELIEYFINNKKLNNELMEIFILNSLNTNNHKLISYVIKTKKKNVYNLKQINKSEFYSTLECIENNTLCFLLKEEFFMNFISINDIQKHIDRDEYETVYLHLINSKKINNF